MTDEKNSTLNDKDLVDLLSDKAGHKVFVDAVTSAFLSIFGNRCGHDSYNVDNDNLQFLAAAIGSSQYVVRHMAKAKRVEDAFGLLKFAIDNMTLDGLVVEFGVCSGNTINHIASLLPAQKIYGFDSFEGLPEEWRPGFGKGAFARPTLPTVLNNVDLVVGLFDRTLPAFLYTHTDQEVALLHVDCDLYSSTQLIFNQLKNRIVPGTIIVFDEYYNFPGWEMHEFRAFKEFVELNRIHYDYIGLVPGHQQVAIRIAG